MDAADRDRLDESMTELVKTLVELENPDTPVLIVLNKADLYHAIEA